MDDFRQVPLSGRALNTLPISMQFRLSSALGPQSTANKNEINYVETFRAVSPGGYVVINTKCSGHATGQPRTSPPPPPCFVAPSTRTASEPRACQKLSTCPKLNFKKKFHLRLPSPLSAPCEWTVVAASLRIGKGLVWSGAEWSMLRANCCVY